MPQNLNEGQGKRNYSKIPIKKRMLLVKLVLKKGVPIGEAIEQLGLKITTARFIINKYKETGTFPRRKFKKRVNKGQNSKPCKVEFEQNEKQNLSESQGGESQGVEEKLKTEQIKGAPHVKMEQADNRMFWVYYPWFML